MAISKKSSRSGMVKKETGLDKRKRLESYQKAREVAKKYIIPLLILFFILIMIFFTFRYGLSGKNNNIKGSGPKLFPKGKFGFNKKR